jgi:transposase
MFKDKRGRIREYYSLGLINIVKKEIGRFIEAPEGWKLNSDISKELGVTEKVIRRIANNHRENHTEYYREFKSKIGKVFEYYSPELVEIIKQEYMKELPSEPPENWQSVEEIAKQTGVTKEEVEAAIRKRSKDYPGQFGKFKSK